MSLLGTVILFTCSLLVGIALPRLPLLIIPRFPVMESGMHPYPGPQPLDEHLILQLMMLRRLWRLSFLFALLPLGWSSGERLEQLCWILRSACDIFCYLPFFK